MQDERSQHQVGYSPSLHCTFRSLLIDMQNRRRAFQVLSARLMEQKLTREMQERRQVRRDLVSTVDRSEKIRTYNYPQVS